MAWGAREAQGGGSEAARHPRLLRGGGGLPWLSTGCAAGKWRPPSKWALPASLSLLQSLLWANLGAFLGGKEAAGTASLPSEQRITDSLALPYPSQSPAAASHIPQQSGDSWDLRSATPGTSLSLLVQPPALAWNLPPAAASLRAVTGQPPYREVGCAANTTKQASKGMEAVDAGREVPRPGFREDSLGSPQHPVGLECFFKVLSQVAAVIDDSTKLLHL